MVQKEGEREVKRGFLLYNLDVIIAVRLSCQFENCFEISFVGDASFEKTYGRRMAKKRKNQAKRSFDFCSWITFGC